MGNFLSKNKNQLGVIITLVFLVTLGAGYFFIYVPGNEKTVQARRFSSLQKIDSNIHSKIENSAASLSNILLSYNDTLQLEKYITDTNNAFNLLYNPIISHTAIKSEQKSGYSASNQKRKEISPADTATTVNIESNSNTLVITKGKIIANKPVRIGVQFEFKQFIRSLLPDEVFGQYVVFGNKDKLYETFPSGLGYLEKDSLLQVTNKITSPGFRSVRIGGKDYKAFTQPVNLGNNTELLIVGLDLNENYQGEKNQLPLGAVLLLLTLAISMIVCLPWIKLYNMGNKDKLTVKDGIESILVSMVLMSLLFFVFFKYGSGLNNDQLLYKKTPYPVDGYSSNILANKISDAFENELQAAYRLLNSCDSLYNNKDSILNPHSFKNNPTYSKLLQGSPIGISADHVYWMDPQGKIINYLYNYTPIPDSSDLSGRDYFQKTIHSQPNHIATPQFYIDQVVSRANNSFMSVIAKSSVQKNRVAAMTFTAKSLDSALMPDGYQFAVIDDKGNVLYHSDPDRNLSENLLNEFGQNSQLLSCIEAKSNASFTTQYQGRQCNLKIKPFKYLPYFIVIFEDKEYSDTRDTEAYFFTFSMLICLLVFLVIQFGVVFFVSAKRSFFKKQLYDTSWIGPKTPSHRQYNMAILANLSIILLLGLFYFFSSFLLYLFILLFSITFTSIMLNGLFASKYKKENLYLFNFKKIAIFWLCSFVLIIDIAACSSLGWSLSLLLLGVFESVSAVLYFYFYYSGKRALAATYLGLKKIGRVIVKARNYLIKSYRGNNSIRIPWTYTHSFSLMATTRLMITSGIPVACFFIYSFNYEQNLDARYRQLLFARSLSGKIYHLASNGNDELKKINNGRAYTSGIYTDNRFIDSISSPDPKYRDSIAEYATEYHITAQILDAFRVQLNSVEVKNNNMNFPSVGAEAHFNYPVSNIYSNKRSTSTFYNLGGTSSYIRLKSQHLWYSYPKWYLSLLFLVSIGAFFYMIHTIVRKLFALNLPSTDAWKKMDDELIDNDALNNLLFIVGSPGSGKLSKLRDKIKTGKLSGHNNKLLSLGDDHKKGNVFIADMILISSENGEDDPDWKECKERAFDKNNALVIINHFEYNVKDLKTNRIKLDFLELLMHKDTSKIIIISTVHPVSFLDSFNDDNSSNSKDQTNRIPENELERWHVLLGHFRIVIKPLVDSPIPRNAGLLKRMVMEETQYSHFLNRMQGMTLSHIKGSDIENIDAVNDSLIFKLQLTSQYFYTYIWQSLTKEEKFLLYDLAEDGLVNPYDDHNLCMLISKGLIIKPYGTLMLFNTGFRNFILTAIGTSEVNRIKEQVKDTGSWGSLRAPLNLVILAILLFLLISQQEAYSRIITYITTIGAGLTAILRVLPMLGSSSTQKTE